MKVKELTVFTRYVKNGTFIPKISSLIILSLKCS